MKQYISLTLLSVIIIGTVMLIYTSAFEKNMLKTAISSGNGTVCVSASENTDVRLAALCADALCGKGEYLTKVAVCGVIFKRTEMSGYPSTVAEVIFSDRIFSRIYGYPLEVEPTEESYCAALDAKLGLSPCPQARGFYLEDDRDNEILKENVMIKLGNFVFY